MHINLIFKANFSNLLKSLKGICHTFLVINSLLLKIYLLDQVIFDIRFDFSNIKIQLNIF